MNNLAPVVKRMAPGLSGYRKWDSNNYSGEAQSDDVRYCASAI